MLVASYKVKLTAMAPLTTAKPDGVAPQFNDVELLAAELRVPRFTAPPEALRPVKIHAYVCGVRALKPTPATLTLLAVFTGVVVTADQ